MFFHPLVTLNSKLLHILQRPLKLQEHFQEAQIIETGNFV